MTKRTRNANSQGLLKKLNNNNNQKWENYDQKALNCLKCFNFIIKREYFYEDLRVVMSTIFLNVREGKYSLCVTSKQTHE